MGHTPKHSQIFEGWRMTGPHLIWCLHTNRNRGASIDQMSNWHNCFSPKMFSTFGIRQKAPNFLHDYPIHPFIKPILLWSSCSCLLPINLILLAKLIKLFRAKFQPIISYKSLNFSTSIGFN